MKIRYSNFYLFGVLVLLTGIVACGTTKETTPEQILDFQSVPMQEVAKGKLYGGGAEGFSAENIVIRNTTEWDAFLSRFDALKDNSSNFNVQNLDFNTEVVIACIDSLRPNGGYEFEIYDVLESKGKVKVILNPEHNADQPAISVLTQPYHIVRVPVFEGVPEYLFK